jgi:hypothetical protein
MNRKLVFWTAFNSYQSSKLLRGKPEGTPHPCTTDTWINSRIALFKWFNLPSILQQKYDDFLYIVLMDPKSKEKVDGLMPKEDSRVLYVYEDSEVLDKLKSYDEIVYALIDSDDMYSIDAGEIMMAEKNKEWMYFKYGYAYDILNKKLYGYDTIGSGPFFAHRFNPKNMKHFDREKRHPTHPAVINFKPQQLPDNNFCVSIHDINTSSRIGMRYILRKEEKNVNILKERFGYENK